MHENVALFGNGLIHFCNSLYLTLSQMTNFRLFQLKEFADDNFKFDKNDRKYNKRVENIVGKGEIARKHCGKRRNCSLRAISPFPTVFSKDLYSRHVKTMACLGKGYYESLKSVLSNN